MRGQSVQFPVLQATVVVTCPVVAVHASAERGLVGCSESAVADGSRGQPLVDHPPSAAAPDA